MKRLSVKRTWVLATALSGAAVLAGFGEAAGNEQSLEERVKVLEEALAAQDTGFVARWNDGVRIENREGDIKIRMGGRLMLDAFWASEDDDLTDEFGELENGADVRRARFYTSGTLYDEVDFKLQFDWAGGDTDLKDAYLALRNFPLGYVRVGHTYEQYSLAALVSSKYNTFMERAPSVNAFSPVRNTGITLDDAALDQRVSWAAGAYWDADSTGETTDEDLYAFTARLTGLPVYAEGGENLVHIGVAGSYRNLEGSLRNRARRSIKAGPHVVDTRTTTADADTGEEVTTDIDAVDNVLYGLEAAAVFNAFHVQAELTGEKADVRGGESYNPFGWYVQAGYFLTGEHRPYSKRTGRFTKVKPRQNFGDGGYGAWEVAARYSFTDLSEDEVDGGELDDITLGLNWYLNPAVRLMANYVYSDVAEVGESHIVGTRFQVAF